jgi:anhydro-N-acetylmuramic acid kinase
MSGTSLDGVDLATVQFDFNGEKWSYSILAAKTFPYPDELDELLRVLPEVKAEQVFEADARLGRFYGELLLAFIGESGVKPSLIASHGHTLFHNPSAGYTTQIGSGAHIAAVTGIDTVCDFRSKDVALKGQGAPLVPVGDRLLFAEYAACLNLGGIANISFDDRDGLRKAFDICPVNMALNELAQREGKAYDDGGEMAASGKVLNDVLEQMQQLEYYSKSGARSLGREWYMREFLPLLQKGSSADLSRTVCEHIAIQHARATEHLPEGSKELITGGGARNRFLIQRMQEAGKTKLILPETELIDFKEAVIFALLGVLNVMGRVNVFDSATGCLKDHVGGALYRGN